MKVTSCLGGLLAGMMLLASSEASAVTWVLSGTTLTGAKGVLVNGKSYDVTFADGTCAGLFSGCNANSDFPFQTLAAATAAGQALLADVFRDVSQGMFDSLPGLTAGCGTADTTTLCRIYIPYQVTGSGDPLPWNTVIVKNSRVEGGDVVTYAGGFGVEDSTGATTKTFAVFTPGGSGDTSGNGGGPVPEPSTWLSMILGFGLVGALLRRRQRRTANCALA